jgi:hypothetical protein
LCEQDHEFGDECEYFADHDLIDSAEGIGIITALRVLIFQHIDGDDHVRYERDCHGEDCKFLNPWFAIAGEKEENEEDCGGDGGAGEGECLRSYGGEEGIMEAFSS